MNTELNTNINKNGPKPFLYDLGFDENDFKSKIYAGAPQAPVAPPPPTAPVFTPPAAPFATPGSPSTPPSGTPEATQEN